jgi:Uma2 family endonuclease
VALNRGGRFTMRTVTRQRNRKNKASVQEYKKLIFELLPEQGRWSDEQYLWLTDHATRLVEFTDGYLEPLPMPTDKHQDVRETLFLLFHAYLKPLGGKVHLAALRLRIREGKFREPDLRLVKDAKDPRRLNRYWTGADLALEVVSEDKPERDLVEKRGDYAEGRVPEYWIVNPQTETITVLRLANTAYVEHGVFGQGDTATSVILPGFAVIVADAFAVDSPPDVGEVKE